MLCSVECTLSTSVVLAAKGLRSDTRRGRPAGGDIGGGLGNTSVGNASSRHEENDNDDMVDDAVEFE